MRKYTFGLFFFFAFACVSAQNIEVKKDVIYIDGKECLKVDKRDPNNISIADLTGNDLVYLKFNRDKYGNLWDKVIFVSSKQSFTSKRFIYNAKLLVKRMLENHVLENCMLNSSKIDNFVMKCDENVQLD